MVGNLTGGPPVQPVEIRDPGQPKRDANLERIAHSLELIASTLGTLLEEYRQAQK